MPKINYANIKNTVVTNLLKTAQKLGIKVTQVDPDFFTFKLEYKGQRHYIFHKKLGINKANSALVSNKYLTNKILSKTGIKVPKSYFASSYNDVLKLIKAKKIKYPFVIKPYDYSLGVAVTVNITNPQMIKIALSRLELYWKKAKIWGKKKKRTIFMVEEYVQGNDYRILVLNNKVIAVTQRAFPRIIGDGKNTVKQLIKNYYQNHSYYQKKNRPVLFDKELKRNLEIQNVKLTDILTKDKNIYLRQTANIFGGGVAININDKIHPFYKKVAVQAAKEFDMNLAGVDLMTQDISKKSNDYRILEINSFPSFEMHENPDSGKPINVSYLVLKSMFRGLK